MVNVQMGLSLYNNLRLNVSVPKYDDSVPVGEHVRHPLLDEAGHRLPLVQVVQEGGHLVTVVCGYVSITYMCVHTEEPHAWKMNM